MDTFAHFFSIPSSDFAAEIKSALLLDVYLLSIEKPSMQGKASLICLHPVALLSVHIKDGCSTRTHTYITFHLLELHEYEHRTVQDALFPWSEKAITKKGERPVSCVRTSCASWVIMEVVCGVHGGVDLHLHHHQTSE